MIEVRSLTLTVGNLTLADLSFTINAGEYVVLMGRTGSGKTTLLEALCGLRPITAGAISILGQEVTHLKPAARGIAYVPQDRVLFMTMSVYHNLAFALALRRWPVAAIDARVHELAELLQLTPLLHRRPHHLSGGEAQRVALGRALAPSPALLLLDEPLSALDDDTRHSMLTLLQTIHRVSRTTILHVTHSLQDAAVLAQRTFHLQDAVLTEFTGAPSALPD